MKSEPASSNKRARIDSSTAACSANFTSDEAAVAGATMLGENDVEERLIWQYALEIPDMTVPLTWSNVPQWVESQILPKLRPHKQLQFAPFSEDMASRFGSVRWVVMNEAHGKEKTATLYNRKRGLFLHLRRLVHSAPRSEGTAPSRTESF